MLGRVKIILDLDEPGPNDEYPYKKENLDIGTGERLNGFKVKDWREASLCQRVN